MKSKILTVSVSAYNVENYIDEALSKFLVLGDMLNDIEILIIDDGGTDRTKDIALMYAQKYPETYKFIHKQNGGWGSTVNTGIRLASGKYFKQLDGDDYFLKENLVNFITNLKIVDCDLYFTPFLIFDDSTGKIIETYKISNDTKKNKICSLKELDECVPNINMHCCTFRTQMLRDNGIEILDHCFYTDAEYFIKSITYVNYAVLDSHIIYCYRMGRNEQSVGTLGLEKHYLDNFKVIDSLVDFEKSTQMSDEKRYLVKKYIYRAIQFQFSTLLNLNKISELKNFVSKVKNQYNYKMVFPRRIVFYEKTNYFGAKFINHLLSKK
jgi:glycosyltransferase involved in cell wall biosynthesis